MNAIQSVFTAFTNLASSINALAGVMDIASGKLRQQLALDAPEVIEHQPAQDATVEEGSTSTKRTSKGKAAAA